MQFDYSNSLCKDSAVVRVFLSECSKNRTGLALLIKDYSTRYGFSVYIDTENDVFPPKDTHIVNHWIYVYDTPYNEAVVQKVSSTLKDRHTASIVFSYPDDISMRSVEKLINEHKRRFGDRINFLRPDEKTDFGWQVSTQKILDNTVCDSVRIKYSVNQLSTSIMLSDTEKKFFQRASEIYERHQMFHRADTDGYFAVRVADGFAITSTKTRKINLDLRRITVVHSYDEDNNIIAYSGAFIPSSDAVEASILFANCPNIGGIIHTHASDKFTRNPQFTERCLVPPLPYGEKALGYALVDALAKVDDGFVIMTEHGEVFAACVEDMDKYFEGIEGFC